MWILFVLVVVFFGDIGALYAGTFLGKHKLYPALSPKKTIEGSLGGLGANIICGGLFKLIFMPELSWGVSLLFFIALGAAGQIGDLFESGLKRVADIKDSGGILPGHGGILDRADAAMYAAPVAYMFKAYLF
jgi:phosphatidate cytidylyltransferase